MPNARGFRLPTSNEWELAARWQGQTDLGNSVEKNGYYFTKGNSASGAAGPYTDAAATGVVAVFLNNHYQTQEVKSKAPNALHLYDMAGNIAELCFEWYPGQNHRITRGGCYQDSTDQFMQLGFLAHDAPESLADILGFRLARTGYEAGEIVLPEVTGVSVSPGAADVFTGGTRQFTAVVAGTGSPPQTVTWTVEDYTDSGTTIDADGLLTVAAGESAGTLTVRATSTYDTTKNGTATVTPKDPVVFIGAQGYESLAEAVAAAAGTTATITVKGNINANPIPVDTAGTDITLVGETTERTITGTGYTLFTLAGTVTLTLNANITLFQGAVTVNSGAALELNTGAKITGADTSGVFINDGGTFTMNDGSIEDNEVISYGGGVVVHGTFIMNGGIIKDNYGNRGGGVDVSTNGTFNMTGGSIQDNEAGNEGGGVHVGYGTFNMTGGSIGGNTTLGNSGGGVFLERYSAINKTGGTIYGYDAADPDDPLANKVFQYPSYYTDRGAAVGVGDTTGSFVSLVYLEKSVGPGKGLSKASGDTTVDALTPAKGWTDD
jgi:hypothetical protein